MEKKVLQMKNVDVVQEKRLRDYQKRKGYRNNALIKHLVTLGEKDEKREK